MRIIQLALLILLSFFKLGHAELQKDSLMLFDTLYSKYLQEEIKLNIYMPKKYKKGDFSNVIIATDGQLIRDNYINTLDSLINEEIISNVILVGICSNESLIKEEKDYSGGYQFQYRNFDFIKANCDNANNAKLKSRYYNYEKFIKYEVIDYLKSINIKIDKRIFFGTSNGAGFGATFSLRQPEFFTDLICLSSAGFDFSCKKSNKNSYPNYYISYGNEELFLFKDENEKLISYLHENEINYYKNIFKGGHKASAWSKEFIRILKLCLK